MDDMEMAVADALIKAQEKEIATLKLQLREMGDHAAALRTALLRYGGHSTNCRWEQIGSYPKETCDCGFIQARNTVPQDYAEKRKCLCPHHDMQPNLKTCLCCGQTVGQ